MLLRSPSASERVALNVDIGKLGGKEQKNRALKPSKPPIRYETQRLFLKDCNRANLYEV